MSLTTESVIDTEVKYRNVDRVWQLGYTGEGVTVPIIDTGVDAAALPAGAVQAEVDLTPDEDKHDHYGHGTLMARFFLGIAPKAKIISVKVFGKSGATTRDDLIRALDYCRDLKPRPKFVNCSLAVRRSFLFGIRCTTTLPCPLCRRVNELWNAGVAVVAATGNFGSGSDSIACPANARWALKVRSLEDAEEFRWRELTKQLPSRDAEDRNRLLGTSQAAAFLSGSLALLSSAFPHKPGSGIAAVLFFSGVALETVGRQVRPRIFEPTLRRGRTSMPNIYRAYVVLEQDKTKPGSWNRDKSIAHTAELFRLFKVRANLDELLRHMSAALDYDESNHVAWFGAAILMDHMGDSKKAAEFLAKCNELLPPAEALEGKQVFGGAPQEETR